MTPSWLQFLQFEGGGAVHTLAHEAPPLSLYWAEEKAKKHTAVQSTTWFYIIHILGTVGHRERQQAELLSWNSWYSLKIKSFKPTLSSSFRLVKVGSQYWSTSTTINVVMKNMFFTSKLEDHPSDQLVVSKGTWFCLIKEFYLWEEKQNKQKIK